MPSGHDTAGHVPSPFTFSYYSANQVNCANSNSNNMYRCPVPHIASQQSPLPNSSICRRN
ncbi:hypothetical protein LOAG_15682, partial [Loa loa]